MQNSTVILQTMDHNPVDRHADTSQTIFPNDGLINYLNFVLDEYADEWASNWVQHYRWSRQADQVASTRRLAKAAAPNATEADLDQSAKQLQQNLTDPMWFTTDTKVRSHIIESSFKDLLELLEIHLQQRPYLLGQQPALADFAFYAQLFSCYLDPTPKALMELRAPATIEYLKRMEKADALGPYESWATLEATLTPIIKDQIGDLFLPLSNANLHNWESLTHIASNKTSPDDKQTISAEFAVNLANGEWRQSAQKSQVDSLLALRKNLTACELSAQDRETLEALNCLDFSQH